MLGMFSQSAPVKMLCCPYQCHEGMWGSGGTDALIPNLDTGLRWVITFILWPLCSWRLSTQYAFSRMFGGPQTWYQYFKKEENLYSLPRTELWLLSCWAYGLVYTSCAVLLLNTSTLLLLLLVVLVVVVSSLSSSLLLLLLLPSTVIIDIVNAVVIIVIIFIIINTSSPGSSSHWYHYLFDRRLNGFQICSGDGMAKTVIYYPCLESNSISQLTIPQSSCYTDGAIAAACFL